MADICRKCGENVPLTKRVCAVCNTDAGFPNIRVATRESEVQALDSRYKDAVTSAKARGVLAVLNDFEVAVGTSKAVMNRSLGALSDWLNGQSELFLTFHNQIIHLGRTPGETDWDQQRESAESTINPFYYRELHYAALTLDERGMTYYGPYSVILKSVTIEDRASVFERNPFFFNRIHHVVAGQSPPRGYRSSWNRRGRLAAAKLQAEIAPSCTEKQFPEILMEPRRNESDCDFVEVHIFGPVNRLGIERIVGPEPAGRVDRSVWKQVGRKAREFGAVVEVTS
jgi:hypothetical protein